MILDGIKIMVLGMSMVFIMLGLLVIATAIAHRIIAAYEGGIETQPPPAAPGEAGEKHGKPIAAIIATAIAMFRRKQH